MCPKTILILTLSCCCCHQWTSMLLEVVLSDSHMQLNVHAEGNCCSWSHTLFALQLNGSCCALSNNSGTFHSKCPLSFVRLSCNETSHHMAEGVSWNHHIQMSEEASVLAGKQNAQRYFFSRCTCTSCILGEDKSSLTAKKRPIDPLPWKHSFFIFPRRKMFKCFETWSGLVHRAVTWIKNLPNNVILKGKYATQMDCNLYWFFFILFTLPLWSCNSCCWCVADSPPLKSVMWPSVLHLSVNHPEQLKCTIQEKTKV